MKNLWKRTLALSLAALLAAGAALPAAASAAEIPAQVDETYYATLDYYGGVQRASVVKSYRLNGAASLTDRGVYDRVTNLTDGRVPTLEGDAVTFTFDGETPEKFYFEGETQKPFEALPWDISVSYRLNGAPAQAQELAGKTGLVEIQLDVVPDPKAPAYSRDNLVLTAAAMFNDDEITSLEAPGAEVQMIGNLRAVLFMVLPGEEQHFVIRVGSEDFSFSGLILLAVPATLRQLEQVADLREAKEKGEDSLERISDSMDAILNAMEGMSGSLNTAARGLDQLNAARGSLQSGKGEVYDKTDLALGDLNALADTLGSLDRYSATASQAITDLNEDLGGLNASAQALRPELENTRKIIAGLQKDTQALAQLLGEVEGYNKKATAIADSLSDQLSDADANLDNLQLDLYRLRNALRETKGVSTLSTSDILSLLSPEEAAQMKQVLQYRQQYENALAAGELPQGTSFADGIVLAAFRQGYEAKVEETVSAQVGQAYQQKCQELLDQGVPAEALPTLEQFMAAPEVQQMIAQAKAAAMAPEAVQTAYQAFRGTAEGQAASAQAQAASDAYDQFESKQPILNTANKKIKEINGLVTGITSPTARVVGDLAELAGEVGDAGLTGDLGELAGLCRDLLKTMKKHEGEGASLLESADELGDLAGRVTQTCDALLAKVDALDDTLDTYEPELQAAVADVQALSGSAQAALRDLSGMLESMEGLLKNVGPQLDTGTRETLGGVSASLRKATVGLGEVDNIRTARNTLKDLIDDEWDAHSGQVDGLLNMDAGAVPVSMTDPRNPAPGSIQYVMRTQEIKAEKTVQEPPAAEKAASTTFWGRVKAMFVDFWHGITGIFGGKGDE